MRNNYKKLAMRVQQLLIEKGTKALELSKKAILEEELKCSEAKDAIKFFTEYWQDLARPTLISICCEAVGGTYDITIPIAASMTMICGATDIHDDIIDKSKRKLSRLTIFGKFGENIALLVGDALLFKGFMLFQKAAEDIPAKKMTQICNVISNMFFELGDAEALELKLQGRMDVELQDYISIIKMKAADIEACARIGAILGNASEKQINAIGNYGRILGTILILRDELADAADYEEALHRIKNEPLPLPILYALQNSEVKSKIISLLLKKRKGKKDIAKIMEIISQLEIIDKLTKMSHNMSLRAHSYIRKIPYNSDLKLLLDAATFL
jgi:geranylgeranyl pyrophosphate synthase